MPPPQGLPPALGVLLGAYWIAFLTGLLMARKGMARIEALRRALWNGRVQQFQYFPFNALLRALRARRFLTSSLAISAVNSGMVAACFLLGLLLVAPLMAAFQGFVVGVLMGKADGRNTVWAMGVLVFEFGSFALAGALGLSVTLAVVLGDLTFMASLSQAGAVFAGGYWIAILVAVLANGLSEAAGPIYWGMKGAIGLEALANEEYL